MSTILSVLSAIWNFWTREPNLTAGFIRAAILCGTAFGLGWTGAQIAAVMTMVEAFLTLATRQIVTPNTKLPVWFIVVALAAASLNLQACGKLKGDTHPDAVTAHFGADILDIIGDVQRTVIDAYKAKQLPSNISDPIMRGAGEAIPYAEKLDAALQAYHSASTLDAQKLAQADLSDLLSKLELAVAKIAGVKLPDGAPARILSLTLKLQNAVQAVRRQFAPKVGWVECNGPTAVGPCSEFINLYPSGRWILAEAR